VFNKIYHIIVLINFVILINIDLWLNMPGRIMNVCYHIDNSLQAHPMYKMKKWQQTPTRPGTNQDGVTE